MDDSDRQTDSDQQTAGEHKRAPAPKVKHGRMVDVPIAEMESATSRALRNAGAGPEAARRSARELVANELDGASAHGLQRVAELVDAMASGDLDPHAEPRVERTGSGSWRVHGGNCLPRDVADHAARALIEGAGGGGMASVAVCSRNSLGRLASIAAPVAEEGLLVLGFARSRRDSASVVAHGGRRGKLGSNPMVFAAPAGEPGADHGPVVVDVATSAASAGEVRSRVARDEPVPEGWLIDRDGNPVHRGDGLDTEPPEAFLLPLGGRSQGHKGFGLALMVEILAGVLTGSRLMGSEPGGGHGSNGSPPEADGVDEDPGQTDAGREPEECAFFVALSPRIAGRDEAAVRRDVESLTRYLEDSGEGSRVEIPGWRARELRRDRLVEGSMALPTPLWTSVLRLAEPRAESEDLAAAEAPPATLTTARVVASRRRPRRPLTRPRSDVASPAPPGEVPETPPSEPPAD